MQIVEHDLHDLPFYNGDLEAAGDPVSVTHLKEAVRMADGVLFFTPEYNYGLTAVLKNAIDWAARGPRGPRSSALHRKPVYAMGASGSFQGTARAQQQLREALVEPEALLLQFPQVLVGRHREKFDERQRLTDKATCDIVGTGLQAFATWIRQVRDGGLHGA